ncbi:MAG: hypothetical protein F2754_12905 [Actinobacteria bacterium]|uniref:Unannotated protein n=1 Tax=freshwater metagenome TaxID=449393 RepID=A0A6J7QTY4_9ZZZZ|nr:hypothetical protein [Actinomycetota bacterium]MSX88276.1 hypothetical protein [Actinomycetota bacterium]MSY71630.1 hypothetical protein [Actinomycetota bacterium]
MPTNDEAGFSLIDIIFAMLILRYCCLIKDPFSNRVARQFRSRDFVAVLKAAGLSGSMGRVAVAGDNAAWAGSARRIRTRPHRPGNMIKTQ